MSRFARPRMRNLVQLGHLELLGVTNTDRMRVWCGYAAAIPARQAEVGTAARGGDASRQNRARSEIRRHRTRGGVGGTASRGTGQLMNEGTKISVVIPVYNEAATIGRVIERVLDCGFDTEVIVVDDASTDGTAKFLREFSHPRVQCFFHSVNRGKGAALRLGFAAAKNPYLFVQDADLEYDPRDYAAMIPPLLDGRADMVYGSRFLSGPHRVMFFWHYVANRAVTLLSDMISDLNLTDMETGMKGFVREKLMTLKLTANRFTFEPEITAKAARARWRIYEVPVSYSGRTYEEGKKIGIRDAVTAVCAILYYRFFD